MVTGCLFMYLLVLNFFVLIKNLWGCKHLLSKSNCGINQVINVKLLRLLGYVLSTIVVSRKTSQNKKQLTYYLTT